MSEHVERNPISTVGAIVLVLILLGTAVWTALDVSPTTENLRRLQIAIASGTAALYVQNGVKSFVSATSHVVTIQSYRRHLTTTVKILVVLSSPAVVGLKFMSNVVGSPSQLVVPLLIFLLIASFVGARFHDPLLVVTPLVRIFLGVVIGIAMLVGLQRVSGLVATEQLIAPNLSTTVRLLSASVMASILIAGLLITVELFLVDTAQEFEHRRPPVSVVVADPTDERFRRGLAEFVEKAAPDKCRRGEAGTEEITVELPSVAGLSTPDYDRHNASNYSKLEAEISTDARQTPIRDSPPEFPDSIDTTYTLEVKLKRTPVEKLSLRDRAALRLKSFRRLLP